MSPPELRIVIAAGNAEGGTTIKSLEVSADGHSQNINFDITGKTFQDIGWTTETWFFTTDAL